jgi:hypothetical protein
MLIGRYTADSLDFGNLLKESLETQFVGQEIAGTTI